MKIITIFILIFQLIAMSAFAQITEVFTIDNERGQDAIIDSYTPVTNYGSHGLLIAAGWTLGGTPFTVRSLLDFGINTLPAGAIILEARLNMSFATYGSFLGQQYGDNACLLKRITEPWEELTVTWNNQPATSSSNQLTIPATTGATQNYSDVDVTQLVQDIVDNPNDSYGLMLRIENEDYYRVVSFASSEYGIPSMSPSLTVTYVYCPLPDASFIYAQNNYSFSFSPAGTNVTSWMWTFGDGNGSVSQSPFHVYASAGYYEVCLTVTDSCGSSTFCDSVFICDPVSADFSWNNTYLTVNFTNNSVNATNWQWQFGDNSFSLNQHPVHTYAEPGIYTACLYSASSCDADSLCVTIDLSATTIPFSPDKATCITLFPNPAINYCTIRISESGSYYLSVLTADGRLLFEHTVCVELSGLLTLPVGTLKEGVYFIRVSNESFTWYKKLLKTN